MKIKDIKIKNFRSHENLELLDLPKTLFITGRNAVGKTSILEAITWAFCGATKHTTVDGKGADCLIKDGELKGVVEVNFDDHNIKRGLPHILSVDNKNGGVKRTTELLNMIIAPLTAQKLLLCFETQRLLKLSDNERRKFLSTVAGTNGNKTKEEIIEDFKVWLQSNGMNEEDTVPAKALSYLNERIINANYQALYKEFYTARTDLNARIEQASQSLPVLKETIENPTGLLEHINFMIALYEVEKKLSENMPGAQARIVKPNISVLENVLKNTNIIHTNNQAALNKKTAEVSALTAQKDKLSLSGNCPIFNKTCPISKEEVNTMIKDIEDDILIKQNEVNQFTKRCQMSNEAIDKAQKKLDEAKKELVDYATIWNKVNDYEFSKLRSDEEIDKLIFDAKKRIEEVNEYVAIKALLSRLDTSNTLNDLKEKAEVNSLLLEAVKPTGIPSIIITSSLRRLESIATEAAQLITNGRYEIEFTASDGDIDISVISDGQKRPISTLSTSEEIWVSLTLSHVVNQFLGNKILLVDEASIFDPTIQAGLQTFINNIKAQYDTIVICATTEEENFLPEINGEDVRRIRLGNV